MGKKYEEVNFIVNLELPLEGLDEVPDNTGGQDIMSNWVIGTVLAFAEQEKGLSKEQHKIFYEVRTKLINACKVKDTNVELEVEEFKFIQKCMNGVKHPAKANEVLMRVFKKFDESISEHSKKMQEG